MPLIPIGLDGVIGALAFSVVNEPTAAAVPPMAGGDAQIVVLQVKPVLLVYCRMLDDVLQLGIANAVGAAEELVAFASTVFATITAIPFSPAPPHAGALDAPVETMVWPLDEPEGFSRWIGARLAPKAIYA
ncbi:conserved hypothetical protein [Paraburkholderia piptadeniae]|uniref:Uncharacterized protein n=1 Tax=Paraburkholderia piptadeniae TaxID=1701573 RepID=A0A1N7SRS7_9BURK|nr:hypothetical protein [Paraburkholderia piptadeniae]SIT50133.1 conserved hypothetical protein [Paraburkholderia piptadeniae]